MRRRSACGLPQPAILPVLAAILLAGGCGETRPTGESGKSFQIVGEAPPCC
ncbi:MAG: hypothetical protein GYA33_15980, partial [Thermogutta sp.]|nr:hypothetical protein [Thermogutta sp.]